MQKGQAPILILVGIFILALVSTGAYYFGKSQALKPQPQNSIASQTPQATPVPSSTSDETANWKTYRNEKYGFEFKYPIDHIVFIGFEKDTLIPASPNSDTVYLKINADSRGDFDGLKVSIKETSKSPKEWITQYLHDEWEEIPFSNTVFRGKVAAEANGFGGRDGPPAKLIVVSLSDNKLIVIEQVIEHEFLTKVLSTFKFTN